MMDGKVSPGEVTRNFYRRQGAIEERERIIKLLEQPQCKTCPNHPGECDVFIAGLEHYISLIKGE